MKVKVFVNIEIEKANSCVFLYRTWAFSFCCETYHFDFAISYSS